MKPQNISHWEQEEIYLVIELSFLHEFCQYLCRQNESVHYCETYFVTRMCMIRIRIHLSVETMPQTIATNVVMIFFLGVLPSQIRQKFN